MSDSGDHLMGVFQAAGKHKGPCGKLRTVERHYAFVGRADHHTGANDNALAFIAARVTLGKQLARADSVQTLQDG